MKSQRGSASVEAVLLAPAIVLTALMLVAAFRYQSAMSRLSAAADAAARAASQVSSERMSQSAALTAGAYLEEGRSVCLPAGITTRLNQEADREVVLVRVSCRLSGQGLGLLLQGRLIHAASSEVVDVYTFR